MSDQRRNPPELSQLGVLLKPKNVLRTFATIIPGASAPSEMLAQLEDHEVELRLKAIEESLQRAPKAIEQDSQTAVVASAWEQAASDFAIRTVNLAVFYDGMHDPTPAPGTERFLVTGHGCVVSPSELLTSSEALEMTRAIARERHGQPHILIDLVRYAIDLAAADEDVGIAVCPIGKRDEEAWEKLIATMKARGVESFLAGGTLPPGEVKSTVQPWCGQEVGFFHLGEAEGTSHVLSFGGRQFERTHISHFHRPSRASLKTFVSGVLPSRFLYAGSPVFTEDSVLLGVVADSESYKSDAGRRAIVRSLLGHPRFWPKNLPRMK